MDVILARHGNTFGPGDKVVWVGARTDLPLVEKGLQQAKDVAAGLQAAGLIPARIYAGPLLRTAETARIVAAELDLPKTSIEIADELKEIDYGSWEARSNDEIRQEVGDAPIDGWQKESIWPTGFDWQPEEDAIHAAWARLIETIRRDNAADATILIVSSNGIYRLVAKKLGLAAAEAKMATGAVGHLRLSDSDAAVVAWNIDPATLAGRTI